MVNSGREKEKSIAHQAEFKMRASAEAWSLDKDTNAFTNPLGNSSTRIDQNVAAQSILSALFVNYG